jgi:hypothetical protein
MVTGSIEVRLDATSFLERAKMFADTQVAASFYFTGNTVADSVPEFMLVELPFLDITDFEMPKKKSEKPPV